MDDGKASAGRIVRPSEHRDENNTGKWGVWYDRLGPDDVGATYGDPATYYVAAAFLTGCAEIEDWGCGRGGFKTFCPGRYIGVDGTKSPAVDVVAELGAYRSSPDGILLRHVLEHNYNWPRVLEAAVASFRRKLCIVLFTPFADTTRELRHNRKSGVDVPDLSLPKAEIEAKLAGLQWRLYENIPTTKGYRVEHVYCVWRPERGGRWAGALARAFKRG